MPVHNIEPLFDKNSEVLILGSIPSPKSREVGFYYGHPQNRFWPAMAAVFDEPVPLTTADRRDFALRHHIALFDVLASCEIDGASDASIKCAVPNDLSRIFKYTNIHTVFCMGSKAANLYAKHCPQAKHYPCITLPSPSAANAAWSLEALVNEYRDMLHLEIQEQKPLVLDVSDVIDIEKWLARNGTPLEVLMRRAGQWLAYYTDQFAELHQLTCNSKLIILCGSGNNGGDGWVAAKHLSQMNYDVVLVTQKNAKTLRVEPARTCAMQAQDELATFENARVLVAPNKDELQKEIKYADIIIDAILGTGFSGENIRTPYDMWLQLANEHCVNEAYMISSDCPSGLHAQTGWAVCDCAYADLTVTMIASKTGLYTEQGPAHCGEIRVAPFAYLGEIEGL